MKKLIKRLVAVGTSLSLTYTTCASAQNVTDTVNNAISASLEKAKADANMLVTQDFGQLIQTIMVQLANNSQLSIQVSAYKNLIDDLALEFQQLSNEDLDRLIKEPARMQAFLAKYRRLVQQTFDSSFAPLETNNQFETAIRVLRAAGNQFQEQCKVGRADKDVNYLVDSQIHVPEYVSRFQVSPSLNYAFPFTGGSPINVNWNYTSQTGGSEAANRDRARILAVTQSASNMASAMWLGSKVGAVLGTSKAVIGTTTAVGGVMNTLSTAMIAAAPYLFAVAVIAMIVVDITAKAEATKANDRIQSDLYRMGVTSASSETVNQFYRVTCEAYAKAIDRVINVMTVVTDKQKSQDYEAEVHKIAPELALWEKESQTNTDNICRTKLGQLIEKHSCQQMKAWKKPKDYNIDNTKPETLCFINEAQTQIQPLSGECELPFDKNLREIEVARAKAASEAYKEKYTPEKISELVAAKTFQILKNGPDLAENLSRISYDNLRTQHKAAFDQLLRLTSMIALANKSAGEKRLDVESKVQREYFEFRSKALVLAKKAIASVFGRANKGEVITGFKNLKASYQNFYLQYRHLPDVLELDDMMGQFIKILEVN